MRIDTFLLADAATSAEGKLYIHGGGISRINVESLPMVLPSLAVLIRWVVDADELADDHLAEFSLTDPDGEPLVPKTPLAIPSSELQQGHLADGEERYVVLGLTFGSLAFRKVGVHRFVVWLDGEEVRSMPLPVVLRAQDDSPADAAPTVAKPNRAQRRSKR